MYIDGGVTRGTDVLKALCLGARGVGLGRAFLYANALYGEEGCRRVVQSQFYRLLNDYVGAITYSQFASFVSVSSRPVLIWFASLCICRGLGLSVHSPARRNRDGDAVDGCHKLGPAEA